MKNTVRFKLRVTAYSPDTMPMARLAEYMLGLASLMGSEANVHYKGTTQGSTVLNVDVEEGQAAQVQDRLRSINSGIAPADVQKAVAKLESLMRSDGARGTLSQEGGERFFQFLGKDAIIAERIGPIREATTLEGELVRIGGKDRTVHALLVSADGREFKLSTTSRDTAKQLAAHLFCPIRVTGNGTWFRSENGDWELDDMRLESFDPLPPRTLMEAVSELRAVQGSGWREMVDPLAAANRMRKH